MSFFKKFFFGRSQQPNDNTGPIPTRELNLLFVASPDNAKKFAQQFVDAVKKIEGKELDYSVHSLKFVDFFLQKVSDEGLTVNDFAETIFVAGSYVGQVMVESNRGSWIRQEDAVLPSGVSMMPIVVKLPNGNVCDPIAKAFKRFHNGEIDSITYFYKVFTDSKRQVE